MLESIMEGSQVQAPAIATLKDAIAAILALQTTVEALTAKVDAIEKSKKSDESTREMTDDDARKVLFGDMQNTKHKDAAKALGLSYGQVYSCRLEFTFKNIHKEMKEKGIKNVWAK